MKAYSLDLRERIVRAVRERGQAPAEAARTFEVSLWTVKRYLRRAAAGRLPPSPIPGRGRLIGPDDEAMLAGQWHGAPDARLVDHCATWAEARGTTVSRATMSRALKRLGWSRKKSRSSRPSGMRRRGGAGGRRSPRSTRPASSSSMNAGRTSR